MAKAVNELRAMTVANVKGGSGKSTLSAALASAFHRFTLPDGKPFRAIWVWADRYGDNELSEQIMTRIFGETGERRVRWMPDRGYYVCLRENLQSLAKALSARGTLHEHLFIFDTGAQLVSDAAASFAPKSDLILLPFNRSGAGDGLAKLTETLTYIARPDGETLDEETFSRVRTCITAMPRDPRMRAAFLRKTDMRDFLSVPLVKSRLLDEPMPVSAGAADLASLRQDIHAGVLRRTHDEVAPLAREIAAEAGWDDLTWSGGADAAMIRSRLREETDRVLAEAGDEIVTDARNDKKEDES